MDISQLSYISPQILSSAIFVILLLFFVFKKKNSISLSFMMLIANLFFWNLSSIMELLSTSNEMTLLWAKLMYLPVCFLSVCLYIFIFNYLEKKEAVSKKNIILLSIIPFLSFVMVLTNSYHHLFFTQESINFLANGLTSSLFVEGIAYWIFLAYTYIVILFICISLIKKLLDKKFLFRNQIFMLLIAIIIPFSGNVIFVLNLFGLNFQYDFTPSLFVITAIFFVISIFKYKLLNISSLARNEIFDELNEALLVLNEKSEIVDFNKKAVELSKNLDIKDLKAGMNAKELLKDTKLDIENDSDFSLSKGSTLYYNSSVKQMFINKIPVGIILSIKDITKIKEFEKIKAESKKKQEISNLREEFITRVSHELRQPLMPIIGYSNELKEMVKSKKEKEYIEKIIFNSENLKELIEKTIKLTKLKTQEKINMEKKKLSEMAKNIAKTDRVKISIIKDSEVLVDESEMLEALNNITENALKYSKKDVEIEIDREDKNAVISVTDKGKGISQQLLDDLIGGTYLAKVDSSELRKGFGIGLLLSRMIIQSHNGKLEIKSKEGKGTTVKIILPTI